jgi:hypothetical protein
MAQILAVMQAAWPGFALGDEQVTVWASQLHDVDARDARAAAQMLVRSDERFPTISRFRSTALGVTRRRLTEEAQAKGLQAGPADRPAPREVGLERIAEIRARLRGEVA